MGIVDTISVVKETQGNMIVTIKRGIALLSTTLLMFLSPFLGTFAQAEGDANNDGMVTSADITCVILGIFEMPCPMPDCNGDGNITSAYITCVILDIFSAEPRINKFVN